MPLWLAAPRPKAPSPFQTARTWAWKKARSNLPQAAPGAQATMSVVCAWTGATEPHEGWWLNSIHNRAKELDQGLMRK